MKNQYIPIEKVLCIVPGNRDKDENMRFFGKKWCQASYAVEAAFTVPLGFLVLFSLSVLFTLLIKGNKVQMSLLHTVQTYAVTGSKMSSAAGVLEQGVLVRWKEQEGTNYCYTGYSESVPFLGSRFFRLHRYQQMAVTDYSGCSMVSDEVADYFVYIAENGKVFHRDRECTYLRKVPHMCWKISETSREVFIILVRAAVMQRHSHRQQWYISHRMVTDIISGRSVLN